MIAGLLAALSPQFAWNSVLLLPDSLSVLPLLLAVYCVTRGVKKPRLVTFVVSGVLVGVSCWLRANTMLLTFLLAAVVPLVLKSDRRWRYTIAVVCGTLLVVLPLTLRNAIVFHKLANLPHAPLRDFGRTTKVVMQQRRTVQLRPSTAAARS